MGETKAIHRRHRGSIVEPTTETSVTIVGYVWGKSRDVGRYSDNREECAMAVCVDQSGSFLTIPISNLVHAEPLP